jgi:hypothetical protein
VYDPDVRIAARHHHLFTVATALALLAVLGAVAGCKGVGKMVGGTGCGSDETANEDPPFCYRIPEGMKPRGEPIRREGHYQIGFVGDAGKVSFLARDLSTFDTTWRALQSNAARAKASDAREEELDGGATRVLTYTTPEKSPRAIVSVLRKGKTHLLECEAEAPKDKGVDALLAACKALHQP